jgi:predicted P-loop ATPase
MGEDPMSAVKSVGLTTASAIAKIGQHLTQYLEEDGPDTEADDIALGARVGLGGIAQRWAKTRKLKAIAVEKERALEQRRKQQAENDQKSAQLGAAGKVVGAQIEAARKSLFLKGPQPKVAEPKPAPPKQEQPEQKPPSGEAKGKGLVEFKAGAVGFDHSKNPSGIPATLSNSLKAIGKSGLQLNCQYDLFHDKIIIEGSILASGVFQNLDNAALKVRQEVLKKYGFDPGQKNVCDAIQMECLDHTFDPMLDYLDGLEWDGRERVDEWLIKYFGAHDTPLNRAIGRKMLLAAVKRVRQPGCKFDHMPVLESDEQGIGKSTALRIIAVGDDNFSDGQIIGLPKRDQQEAIQGVWIYEVGELEGMSKAEVTSLKSFMSRQYDCARPAYGRARVDRPRRCILVGTTNDSTYLRDKTGNRRFWPVKCYGVIWNAKSGMLMVDLEGLKRDRAQLWAEAAVIEAAGEGLFLPEELWSAAKVQQRSREELDPWEDLIAIALARKIEKGKDFDGKFAKASDAFGRAEWRVSSDWILTEVLHLSTDRQNSFHAKTVAAIMRRLGWTRPDKVMRIAKGSPCHGYIKPVDAGIKPVDQVEVIPPDRIEILPPVPQGIRRI